MPVAEAAPAPIAAPPAAAVSSPAKPQAREVAVSQMPPPTDSRSTAPAKPGSAKAAMFEKLKSIGKQEPGTEGDNDRRAAPSAKPDPKSNDKPRTEGAASAEEADAGEPENPKPTEVSDPAKKGKVSPWKLVEEYKAKLATAEARALEVEKRAIPEDKWKQHQETLTAREKRLSELEEEIRYVNYSKSDDFKTKYQQPYEKSWQRAMSELGELTIETGDGNARPMAAGDLLELVNLPLGKAHEMAVEKFGDLAPEVMAHRKEIRKLHDEQAAALDEARKSGASREKELTEKQQREYGEISGNIKDTWSKANDEVTGDPKYGTFFTPKDGDEQGNQRLAKGFELADRAFSENPLTPGLTPEQRAGIVRRHAAVRNRAAAFGRLVYQNNQSQSRIAELEKQLSEYKGSEPGLGGSQPKPATAGKRTGMSGIKAGLEKIAR